MGTTYRPSNVMVHTPKGWEREAKALAAAMPAVRDEKWVLSYFLAPLFFAVVLLDVCSLATVVALLEEVLFVVVDGAGTRRDLLIDFLGLIDFLVEVAT